MCQAPVAVGLRSSTRNGGGTQVVEASVEELIVVWEEGDKGERITALKAIRRTAPEKARELVQAVWDTETAADRAGFMGVMSQGVSLQDESWLEALLDDRSKQVRAAVTRLLSLIPESGMAERMAWRVDSWIDRPPARGKKQKDSATIEFMPPDELDPSAVRDGLQMKSVGGLGPKAELLRGIASRAPLSAWANRGGDAAAWLDAARKSDWADALCRGWIEAAALQRHAEWAEAVLLRLLDDATSHDELQRARITQLMDALPRESAERVTLNAVANRGLVERPRVVEAVLNACDFGWGEELSRAVAGAVRDRLAAKEAVYDTFLRQILRLSAVRIDPSVTEEVGRMWTESQDHWSANLGELVHDAIGTVRLRRDMLAALKNSPAQ
ncbi:hypothetical protein KOR34_08990 [Posidoniimonas corsicana]|uniref:Uncharacterized protein n=1 Tax=Posidoniimonas corsicana TaxID=1938618 RepID=A0A5C5VE69_9BACT|nr:DUF5691 domain-containing protein [Posidoniimonas corsicana]TWT36002.1 hypothetical protein KOR34_08990 [Posidoniimonas corsicana]